MTITIRYCLPVFWYILEDINPMNLPHMTNYDDVCPFFYPFFNASKKARVDSSDALLVLYIITDFCRPNILDYAIDKSVLVVSC